MAKAKSEKVTMTAVEMLAKLRAEKEAMLAQLAAQEAEIVERAKAEEMERAEKLNALLAETLADAGKLGVADKETFALIVRNWVKNGTVALAMTAKVTSGAGRGFREIPEDVKAACIEKIKAGKPLSVVSNEHGVSVPTLFNWKKELGLVKSRTETPAPASAPSA